MFYKHRLFFILFIFFFFLFFFFFLVATPVLVLFARLLNVFLNHIIVMCSLIWKQNIYLEQMDSSNTGMSYEQDILLLNFCLLKSGII